MRYVIVCTVKGEAGEFNNNLRKELFKKYKTKSSKLPAHFTIKAPFEYDGNIEELEKCIEDFWKEEKPEAYSIEGYDHFDDRVIYMNVNMSEEGKKMHDRLIDKMSLVPYIDFTKKDGKDKTFHITLATRMHKPLFNEVFDYVNQYPCKFKCKFDNVSIYKFEDYTWKLYKEFIG
ncbi:2'-5' RNA ligase family protein [Clostridium oryzae]|uniref:2',5' RNA ligase family n=1 Tax=Clostridium oryzae TaxID=1450648 RepID=A0A1V4IIN9_9CLOT|nr:2'-5' RNA ligase family protein [Clostridium oryzae]OPJ59872.1 hypothetical protein CLORY_30890 [Clostridium oryzae]